MLLPGGTVEKAQGGCPRTQSHPMLVRWIAELTQVPVTPQQTSHGLVLLADPQLCVALWASSWLPKPHCYCRELGLKSTARPGFFHPFIALVGAGLPGSRGCQEATAQVVKITAADVLS